TGRLANGAITDVVGQFGPVTAQGNVQLDPLDARLGFDIAPLTVRVGAAGQAPEGAPNLTEPPPPSEAQSDEPPSSPVRATLASTTGTLTFAAGVLEV